MLVFRMWPPRWMLLNHMCATTVLAIASGRLHLLCSSSGQVELARAPFSIDGRRVNMLTSMIAHMASGKVRDV